MGGLVSHSLALPCSAQVLNSAMTEDNSGHDSVPGHVGHTWGEPAPDVVGIRGTERQSVERPQRGNTLLPAPRSGLLLSICDGSGD